MGLCIFQNQKKKISVKKEGLTSIFETISLDHKLLGSNIFCPLFYDKDYDGQKWEHKDAMVFIA